MARWLWWSMSAAVVAVFVAMCGYAFPQADDFVFANSVRDHGFFASQCDWYRNWSGRWASTAVITWVSSAVDLQRSYWIVPAAAWALTIGAFWCLWRAWVPRAAFDRASYAMAPLLLCAVYAVFMPSCSEALYWLAGSATYQLGAAAALTVAVAAPIAIRARGWRRLAATGAAAAAAAVAAGTNETVMACEAFVLGVVVALRWRGLRSLPWSWLVTVCLAAAASTAVVVLAPGNAVRSAGFPSGRNPWLAAAGAANELIGDLSRWSATPTLLLGTLLLLTARPRTISALTASLPRALRRKPSLFLGAWMGTLYASLFPAWWAEGQLVENRVSNVTWLIFVLGWPMMVALGAAWFHRRYSLLRRADRAPAGPTPTARWWLRACFALALLGSELFVQKIADLRAVGPEFARQQRARYAEIAAARASGTQDLEVQPITAFSSTLYSCDITFDARSWLNRGYAAYFGFRSARTK
jgi:hypothetical protein